MEGSPLYLAPKQKTGKNDLHELQENNYGYNEGSICLVCKHGR